MSKIAVIGVGAMGSLFAGRLAPYAEVSMIGQWQAQLATIQANGLRVRHHDGHETVHFVSATDAITQVGQVDVALVLVKSYQTEQAARYAAQIVAPDGAVVTLQNGIGNLPRIARVVGAHRAALGVTAQGAMLISPGVVQDTGPGPVSIALPSDAPPALAREVRRLVDRLRQARFTVHVVATAESLLWGKLAVNAGLNPLTALLGVRNGFLATHDDARTVLQRAALETAAVAQAQGITLPYADAGQYALEVAQATATNRSSMLQDVQRGAPTEIDTICGAIVRTAHAYGVPVPVNALLDRLVRLMEHGAPVTIGAWGSQVADADTIRLLNTLLAQAPRDELPGVEAHHDRCRID